MNRRLRECVVSVLVLSAPMAATADARADVVTQPLRKFGLGDLQGAVLSPDGKWMATCGSGGAFVWDYETGTMLHRLEAHHMTSSNSIRTYVWNC